MTKKDEQPETLLQFQENHSRMARTLAEIGFIWPGTIQKQMLTCGKSQCSCHKDPEARHGPYWYWTSKKKGKTISRKLTPEEAAILGSWIENRRKTEATLKEMAQISVRALPFLLKRPDRDR